MLLALSPQCQGSLELSWSRGTGTSDSPGPFSEQPGAELVGGLCCRDGMLGVE